MKQLTAFRTFTYRTFTKRNIWSELVMKCQFAQNYSRFPCFDIYLLQNGPLLIICKNDSRSHFLLLIFFTKTGHSLFHYNHLGLYVIIHLWTYRTLDMLWNHYRPHIRLALSLKMKYSRQLYIRCLFRNFEMQKPFIFPRCSGYCRYE